MQAHEGCRSAVCCAGRRHACRCMAGAREGALIGLLAYLFLVPCCSAAAAARAGQWGSEAMRRGGEAAGRSGRGSGASSSSSSLSPGGRGAGRGRCVSLGASGGTRTGQRTAWARAWDQIYRSSSNHGGTGGSLSPQNSGISCVGHHSTPEAGAGRGSTHLGNCWL